ncbi:MAG: hypothetical protein R3A51_10485 [Nannocystaceae bacterium]
MELGLFDLPGVRLGMLLMPRGSYRKERLEKEGDGRVYAVFAGRLSIQTCDGARPRRTLVVSPGSPVVLDTPGSYHVTADQHSVGVRGVRCV